MRVRCVGAVRKASAIMIAHDTAKVKPGAAREAQQQAEQKNAGNDDVDDADTACNHALKYDQRRPNQERAEHIGVLEGAERAVDRRE